MEEAAFWVGPSDDPDRYRLTHLLGSGGEGEVWRALRTDQTEVAIKIDRVPESATDGWEKRMSALSELKVKGLVQVIEAFTGAVRHRLDDDHDGAVNHRYVVMDHVQGMTLRTWLDENPDAPARHRMKILRGVAATLSALHRGPASNASITHGDVKPTNVIIQADGRPVLVDLGLLRPAGSGPVSGRSAAYSSPELRNPDASPSPQADTFSFAVTAMETLTSLTPPLDSHGILDLDVTRQRVRTDPSLRLRPVLRRQLLRSLTPEPDHRPPTPIRVFAGRTTAVVLVPLLILGASGSAFALTSGTSRQPSAGPTEPTPTQTTSGVQTATVDPPTAPPSPKAKPKPKPRPKIKDKVVPDSAGILTGSLESGYGPTGVRDCGPSWSNIHAIGIPDPGSWGHAGYGVTLTSHEDLRVLSVTRKPLPPKGTISFAQYFNLTCPTIPGGPVVSPPTIGCKKRPRYRQESTYDVDADQGTWREALGSDTRAFGVQDFRCYGASELSFGVKDCRTNVDYQITLSFKRDSDPHTIYQHTFKVMHLRGRATRVPLITSLEGAVSNSRLFSGSPDGCPGAAPWPTYGNPNLSRHDRGVHESFELVFHGIEMLRKRAPNLTRTEAVALFLKRLPGPDRRMADGYGLSDVLRTCRRADLVPTAWRYSCGKPDPKPTTPPSPTPTP